MGVLEIQDSIPSEDCDRLMNTLLRAVSVHTRGRTVSMSSRFITENQSPGHR